MAHDAARGTSRLWLRKSIEDLQREGKALGLKRTLGPVHLLFLGIGCILGAGIYVMTGHAAANFAGPAVILSFVIAGSACALAALCYAELASTIPVSGSSYTYCYATIGEVGAWALGWLLMLEYTLASATLAVGFSGYFVSLMGNFGVHIPATLATPTVQSLLTPEGMTFVAGGGFNLIAVLAIVVVTALLTVGVTESARANNIMVFIKIVVLIAFVVVGAQAIDPDNWQPFVPEHQGDFTYGWPGILRAASIVFFAYIGFETVSTAAAEARDPQRHMPIGILGSLVVCIILYIVVAAVLTGVVSYRELSVPDPIAVAVDHMNRPQFAMLIKLGALMGLSSVLLVNAYGQSRISFAMSKDGLLPPLFSTIHPRFLTPHLGTIVLGVIAALLASLLPITLLGDLVSLAAALAFSIVSFAVMWLRNTRPDLKRPFRVPFGGVWIRGVWIGYIPTAAMILCCSMIVPVILDIIGQARRGHVIPAVMLGTYAVAGALVYAMYGLRRSRLGNAKAAGAGVVIDQGLGCGTAER